DKGQRTKDKGQRTKDKGQRVCCKGQSHHDSQGLLIAATMSESDPGRRATGSAQKAVLKSNRVQIQMSPADT
ncbi:MAG TPA: hypothetical protein PLB25_05745, partial [Rhodoferax sp.]|nr:hypothetical protein [Rhodoferax sp.]